MSNIKDFGIQGLGSELNNTLSFDPESVRNRLYMRLVTDLIQHFQANDQDISTPEFWNASLEQDAMEVIRSLALYLASLASFEISLAGYAATTPPDAETPERLKPLVQKCSLLSNTFKGPILDEAVSRIVKANIEGKDANLFDLL